MTKKVVKKPEDIPPVPHKPAQQLFNELIRDNNLVITVSPSTNVKVVSDGSMIIDAPFVNVRYKDGR